MRKYDKLTEYFKNLTKDHVSLSFDQIENIINKKLPSSAHNYPAWWSNNASSNRHSYGWLLAGWRSEDLNLVDKRVGFAKFDETMCKSHAKPNVGKSEDFKDLPASPVHPNLDLNIRLNWRELGSLALDEGRRILFPKAPNVAALYRLRIDGQHYVGETVNLRRRFRNYRTPGRTQQTSIRINQALLSKLTDGRAISVDIMIDDAQLTIDGAQVTIDLLHKPTRRMIEQAVLVSEASKVIENLNR